MYQVSNNFYPPHMNKIFEVRNEYPYNLSKNSQLSRLFIKSVYHGIESLPNLGLKVWDMLATISKNRDGLDKFAKDY